MPTDSRVEVLADEVMWQPAGAALPLTIDVATFFASVLDN